MLRRSVSSAKYKIDLAMQDKEIQRSIQNRFGAHICKLAVACCACCALGSLLTMDSLDCLVATSTRGLTRLTGGGHIARPSRSDGGPEETWTPIGWTPGLDSAGVFFCVFQLQLGAPRPFFPMNSFQTLLGTAILADQARGGARGVFLGRQSYSSPMRVWGC